MSKLDNKLNKKTAAVSAVLVLCAIFILTTKNDLSKPALDLDAQSRSATTGLHSSSRTINPSSLESNAVSSAQPSDPGSSKTGNASGTQAIVSVNGQSISTTTNSENPNASVNRMVKTDNGNTDVSIQSNTSTSSTNSGSSFSNIQVNSNSNGSSNMNVDVSQQSSGGNTP